MILASTAAAPVMPKPASRSIGKCHAPETRASTIDAPIELIRCSRAGSRNARRPSSSPSEPPSGRLCAKHTSRIHAESSAPASMSCNSLVSTTGVAGKPASPPPGTAQPARSSPRPRPHPLTGAGGHSPRHPRAPASLALALPVPRPPPREAPAVLQPRPAGEGHRDPAGLTVPGGAAPRPPREKKPSLIWRHLVHGLRWAALR